MTQSKTTATGFSWSDLHGVNPVFFWSQPGDHQPSVTATLTTTDGKEISDLQAAADYNLNRPAYSSTIIAHPSRIATAIYIPPSPAPGSTATPIPPSPILEFGTPVLGTEGVDFTLKVTNDAGYPGQIGMVQEISYTDTTWNLVPSPTTATIPVELDNGSDQGPFYDPPVKTPASYLDPGGLPVVDAPGVLLNSATTSQSTVSMVFDDYFMYMPNGRNGNDKTYWVLLSRGGYSWTAGATYNAKAHPPAWCRNGNAGCPNSSPIAVGSATSPYDDWSDLPNWSVDFLNPPGTEKAKRSRTVQLNGTPWTTPLLSL
jgi:hypothetical protein